MRVYKSRVVGFLGWLAQAAVIGEPLVDPAARDWAVRDYRTYLITVARRKPSTVNAHLTAIDDFYRRQGVGPAAVRRKDLVKAAPRALDYRDQLRWLRAAEHERRPEAMARGPKTAESSVRELVDARPERYRSGIEVAEGSRHQR